MALLEKNSAYGAVRCIYLKGHRKADIIIVQCCCGGYEGVLAELNGAS